MKKRNRLLTVLLALMFTLTSVQLTFAADVSDNFNSKTPNIKPNVLINGNFEKNSDSDAYTFISGGGMYKLVVYTKTTIKDPFGWYEDDKAMPVELSYSTFEKFSAAAGDPARYQWGGDGIHTYESISVKEDGSGWYVGEIELDSFKKYAKVGIRFDTQKAGVYKFKVVGANSPAPGTATLKSVKGKKKAALVKWKKVTGASGYQIQYSKDKTFKSGIKSSTVKKGSTLSKTIKIKKKGRYYFRVRAYKKVADTKVYGNWSKTKSGKVK